MSRFYLIPENINFEGNRAVLADEEWQHAAKTLRFKVGDNLEFFDGQGGLYQAVIEGQKGKSFLLKIINKEQKSLDYQLKVYIGLPKAKKMDFIVKALTQVGATTIGSFISSYTIAKDKKEKIERLQKIAIESCKQSGRLFLPSIISAISFNDLLGEVKTSDSSVVFYEKANHYLPASFYKNKNITLIIGPEGGFSEEEIGDLEKIGARISCLNDGILRVETAAIAATQIARYFKITK